MVFEMFPLSAPKSVGYSTDSDSFVSEHASTRSEETNGTRLISRRRYGQRRAEKIIDRSVSWSNTIDTYEERGNHTFESFDTREGYGSDDVSDEYGEPTIDLVVDRGLISDFNIIYPGDTNVGSDESDGFEISDEDHQRMITPQTPGPASIKTPPPPPPTMGPKVTKRKQPLSTFMTKSYMATRRAKDLERARRKVSSNLEGESMASEVTMDKYKGRGDGDVDKNNMRIGNEAVIGSYDKAVQKSSRMPPNEESKGVRMTTHDASHLEADIGRVKTSSGRPLEGDDISTIQPSTVGSLSMEEATLGDTTLGGRSTMDSGSVGSSSTDERGGSSFESLASWDASYVRAGSDDTSIVSLLKQNHDYDAMFKNQKQADTLAGHIGLILPFWGGRTTGNPLSTILTMFENSDAEVATKDSTKSMPWLSPTTKLQSNTSTFIPIDAREIKSNSDDNVYDSSSKDNFCDSKSENHSTDGDVAHSQSMNNDVSAEENDEKCSKSSQDLSNNTRGISLTPLKCSSDTTVSAQSHKNDKLLSIEVSDVKNDPSMQDSHKRYATESSLINDASDKVVSSGSSSGLISTQWKLNDESDEQPALGDPTGEIFLMQDLGRSKNYSEKNKDKKTMCSKTEGDSAPLSHPITDPQWILNDESGELPAHGDPTGEIFIIQDLGKTKKYNGKNKDEKTMRNKTEGDWAPLSHPITDHTIMDTPEKNNRDRQQEKKKRWSWRWKKNTQKVDQYVSGRFDPISLPSGRVRDDDSCCGASYVSTDSILSELKLIENTAKLMYQKLILEKSGKMGPNPEETELVLEKTIDAGDDSNREQPAYQQEEDNHAAGKMKKGGKFSKFIGRKLRFGPIFGLTATPN